MCKAFLNFWSFSQDEGFILKSLFYVRHIEELYGHTTEDCFVSGQRHRLVQENTVSCFMIIKDDQQIFFEEL